jgi:hypothetical protein
MIASLNKVVKKVYLRQISPLKCAEFILFVAQFLTEVGIPWTKEDLHRRFYALPVLNSYYKHHLALFNSY